MKNLFLVAAVALVGLMVLGPTPANADGNRTPVIFAPYYGYSPYSYTIGWDPVWRVSYVSYPTGYFVDPGLSFFYPAKSVGVTYTSRSTNYQGVNYYYAPGAVRSPSGSSTTFWPNPYRPGVRVND